MAYMYPCIREKVNAPTAEQLVYDELKKAFPAMKFDRLSPCSGILSLRK